MEVKYIRISTGPNELFAPKSLSDVPGKPTSKTIPLAIEEETEFAQKIAGFGASFTDSSAYLINQVIDGKEREELMQALFDHNEGIGISVIRNPMGSSDYARDYYSYNDIPKGETDYELKKFSIEHDLADILPLTKEARNINPGLKLMASPWSAPAWMKTTDSMQGGELRTDCYGAFAEYFAKFIKAYEEHGVRVDFITPQNEPLYVPPDYSGMHMSPNVQAEFIKDHLKPIFNKYGITTKILCFDHNWKDFEYPMEVLEKAGESIDGVAWHWYEGDPTAQLTVQKAYPNTEIHVTESSGGEWIPEFEPAFSTLICAIIESLRNGTQSFVLWNMALDENNGPAVPGFRTSTCRGIIKVDRRTGEFEYTIDYYGLAHFSKYILPEAVRIDTDCAIPSIAFRNTDNTLVIVLFNNLGYDVNVEINNKLINMPDMSAATIVLEC